MVWVWGDFMKRPSGQRSPVPLLFGSCEISEMGLRLCFLCRILLFAVRDGMVGARYSSLSLIALSNLGFATFFLVEVKGVITNSFGSLLLFHR